MTQSSLHLPDLRWKHQTSRLKDPSQAKDFCDKDSYSATKIHHKKRFHAPKKSHILRKYQYYCLYLAEGRKVRSLCVRCNVGRDGDEFTCQGEAAALSKQQKIRERQGRGEIKLLWKLEERFTFLSRCEGSCEKVPAKLCEQSSVLVVHGLPRSKEGKFKYARSFLHNPVQRWPKKM